MSLKTLIDQFQDMESSLTSLLLEFTLKFANILDSDLFVMVKPALGGRIWGATTSSLRETFLSTGLLPEEGDRAFQPPPAAAAALRLYAFISGKIGMLSSSSFGMSLVNWEIS